MRPVKALTNVIKFGLLRHEKFYDIRTGNRHTGLTIQIYKSINNLYLCNQLKRSLG
jgi:hypothetical protein